MEKHLHIICLNVPYPVDYGGVFDIFYKLPALQQKGVKIHLHCFEYGRGEQAELNKYCESVNYYSRSKGYGGFSLKLPYIVASRSNEQLLNKLLEDNYPILMEGVHCTFLLADTRFASRKCFVRLHNVEHVYYRNLFRSTSAPLKRLYYWWESKSLYKYEKKIAATAAFWTVSPKDVERYQSLGCQIIEFLPLFLPTWKVTCNEGKGHYCLYHGDLSVAENEKAATWLLKKVFNNLDLPFVIAGKNPPGHLSSLAKSKNNICFIANPSWNDMQDLIEKAHIHIIPSFNATGIKLKLINALFNGRHCLVNEATVYGTGLGAVCHVAAEPEEFKKKVKALFLTDFTTTDISIREKVLYQMFNNEANAQQIMRRVWPEEYAK